MKKILLIDDCSETRKIFSMALRNREYHILEAESGQQGLVLARRHRPDLILTDVQMPNGDGATLLSEIRNDPALSITQVVLMTGMPELVGTRDGMERGADDFLLKPVCLESLVKCVESRFQRADLISGWRKMCCPSADW